jgi:hypothetical protein
VHEVQLLSFPQQHRTATAFSHGAVRSGDVQLEINIGRDSGPFGLRAQFAQGLGDAVRA